jgi:hypothetical protein
VPRWNVLSVGRFGCVNSLDVQHCRFLLPKGVDSYGTVPFRILLSKLLVTSTLPCRCRQVGSGLGCRFGFGFGFEIMNMIGISSCVLCLVVNNICRCLCVKIRVGVKIRVRVRVSVCLHFSHMVVMDVMRGFRVRVYGLGLGSIASFVCFLEILQLVPRFCRDIFWRHGCHVILDLLLRLCCRYLCLDMSFYS